MNDKNLERSLTANVLTTKKEEKRKSHLLEIIVEKLVEFRLKMLILKVQYQTAPIRRP